jgi:hypothetical protein
VENGGLVMKRLVMKQRVKAKSAHLLVGPRDRGVIEPGIVVAIGANQFIAEGPLVMTMETMTMADAEVYPRFHQSLRLLDKADGKMSGSELIGNVDPE